MKLEIAHKKFIEKLRSEGKSEATVVAYRKDVEQVITFLEKKNITDVEGMNIEDLRAFMKSLEEKDYAAKSISRKTNAVRTA